MFGDIGITAAESETFAQALLEGNDACVVRAGIPGTEAINGRRRRGIGDTRSKGQIGLANAENVFDVFMIVVQRNDPIVAQLTLDAESVAARVRSGKGGIDGDREIAGRKHLEGESAKWSP